MHASQALRGKGIALSKDVAGGGRSIKTRRRAWIAIIVVSIIAVAAVVWGVASMSRSAPSAGPSGSPAAGTPSASPSMPQESIDETSAPETDAPETPIARETTAPVELDGEQQPLDGVTVRLISIESVTGEVVLPGEVAGPALRVTMEARNSGGLAVETPAVVVNLYYGPDRIAGNPFLQPGGKPFPASIPAGGLATGVYLFDVPESERGDILVEVDLLFESSVVLFEGAFAG